MLLGGSMKEEINPAISGQDFIVRLLQLKLIAFKVALLRSSEKKAEQIKKNWGVSMLLEEIRTFYRWAYCNIDYSKFCKILGFAEDAYSLDLFCVFKDNYGKFMMEKGDCLDKLYKEFLKR